MIGLRGTVWRNRKTGRVIEIVSDAFAAGGLPNRDLLARSEKGRHFWTTPHTLERRYTAVIQEPASTC